MTETMTRAEDTANQAGDYQKVLFYKWARVAGFEKTMNPLEFGQILLKGAAL